MLRLRDLSHNGKLFVRGKDRVRFLNGLFTNDIARLQVGGGCHAAMLTVKGKLLGDAIILCAEDRLIVELLPMLTGKIRDQLERHLIVDEVDIDDVSEKVDEVAVYGDEARRALERHLGPLPELSPYGHVVAGETRVVRVAELGLLGYRLLGGARRIADALTAEGAILLSDEEAEVLRVEAGQPRYGVDMGEDHLPLESRLDDAISYTKGCYMGQEVIARATARGHVNRKLCGLRLDGPRAAQAQAKLRTPGRDDAGYVTSSVVSPRFGAVALAYVHKSAWAPGTEVEVLDAAGPRRAVVADLPFAR